MVSLDIVERAAYEPLSIKPNDIPPTTPSLVSHQTYRQSEAATGGIDVDYFSGIQGGNGAGVYVIDLEGGLNTPPSYFVSESGSPVYLHEDLPSIYPVVPTPTGFPDSGVNHSTAVAGTIAALDNGYGMTGIAPNVFYGHMQANYSNLENALNFTTPGDVILLEIQSGGANCPFERISQDNYDAVRSVTLQGRIVIECAGNSDTDLDQTTPCDDFGNGSDAGAIMVGGGTADQLHSRLLGSYGAIVDVQGWSTDVSCPSGGLVFGSSHIGSSAALFNWVQTAYLDTDKLFLGDCDGDGLDDVIACRNGSPSCIWRWSRNTSGILQGVFSAESPFTASSWFYHSEMILFGDFDGDGLVDILDRVPSSGRWYRSGNLGSCTFPSGTPPAAYIGGSQLAYQTTDRFFAADYNNDGRDDIIACRPSSGLCQWWASASLGNGNFSGLSALTFGGSQVAWLANDEFGFGDYDGDGMVDLLVQREEPGDVSGCRRQWLYAANISGGAFSSGKNVSIYGVSAYCNFDTQYFGLVNADDFVDILSRRDRNGQPDDDLWSYSQHFGTVSEHVIANPLTQLYGDGFNGTSAAGAMVAGVVAAIQGVFRQDGSTGCSPESMHALLIQSGSPQDPSDTLHIGPLPNLRNAAKYLFYSLRIPLVNGSQTSFYDEDQVLNCDVNGDGYADIFIRRPSTGAWWVSYNNGSGGFGVERPVPVGGPFYSSDLLLTGDLNDDGFCDILARRSSGSWVRSMNSQNGTFGSSTSTSICGLSNGFASVDAFDLVDLNGDGADDLVVHKQNIPNPNWVKAFNHGGGTFGCESPLYIDGSAYSFRFTIPLLASGDYDGDGFGDIMIRLSDNTTFIAINNGDSTMKGGVQAVVAGSLTSFQQNDRFGVGDFNHDGECDLLVRRPVVGKWYLSNHVTLP